MKTTMKKVLVGLLIFSAVICCNAFVFTNYLTVQLDTAPATGINPPAGCIYQWWTKSGSVLTLNWRDSSGVNHTFSGSGGGGTTYTAGTGISIVNGVISATGSGDTIGTVVTITTSQAWTVPTGVTLLKDVWIFGGGGAGSQDNGNGGGAGGMKHLTNYVITPGSNITVIIGAGGSPVSGSVSGGNGGDSSFDGFIAFGGAGGQYYSQAVADQTTTGGCSGGHSYAAYAHSLQGFEGGRMWWVAGGGGGGVSSGGLDGGANGTPTYHKGGNGGDGIDLSYYVGTSIGYSGWFGGGGGGGGCYATSDADRGLGGRGGANGGSYSSPNGLDAIANSGGGGGGAMQNGSWGNSGGAGGSGIIIIRY